MPPVDHSMPAALAWPLQACQQAHWHGSSSEGSAIRKPSAAGQ
jgi:hypothetical protein